MQEQVSLLALNDYGIGSVHFSPSVVSDSVTLWIAACQASLSIINSQSSLRLMSIERVMVSSHLILCCPLLLLSPIPPSIRVFSNEIGKSTRLNSSHSGQSRMPSSAWKNFFNDTATTEIYTLSLHDALPISSIESVMPPSHLILCRPLLLLPPIPPSIRVFSNESILRMRWPKYWSFSFRIIPSKEIPGLISFRMDWLDLLAVQGTLKSLLQHHSSKASILRRSAFFAVQLILRCM